MIAIYGVFDTKDAAELAVEHIENRVPNARIRHLDRIQPKPKDSLFPLGTVFPGPGNSSLSPGTFAPYPMVDNVRESDQPGGADAGGETALCVEVPDEKSARYAQSAMRRMGGTGLRTDDYHRK